MPPPAGALVGQTFGNWRLVRPLGEGAFGEVYEGEHLTIARRRAAVKVLHGEVAAANPQIKRRFLNEAVAASRAEHPNIVQIFDAAEGPDGRCYVVMELLDGQSLKQLTREAPLPPARVVELGRQLAGGLAAAHRQGVVHRDLKPDNVFVLRRSEGELIKILDFGVAKLQRDAGLHTGTGILLGTPSYMSPEQWRAERTIDGRADIYALGIILFELAAGRRPFVGKNPYDWMRLHLSQPVPDPVAAGVTPPALGELIARMLAKRRDERPASMEEVEQRLVAIGRSLWGQEAPTHAAPLHAQATQIQAPRRATGQVPVPPPAVAVVERSLVERGGRVGLIVGALLVLLLAFGVGWLALAEYRRPGGIFSSVSSPAP